MSSDSELNSFANLSRISDQDIMEEDEENVEESLTHKQTLCVAVTWKTFSLRRHFKSSSYMYTGLKVNDQLVAYVIFGCVPKKSCLVTSLRLQSQSTVRFL